MLKFWLNRAYVSASCLLSVAIGSYAATIPSAPVLNSPASVGFPEVTFSWYAAAGASYYALQTSTDYYFSTTFFSQTGITDTTLILPASDSTVMRSAFDSSRFVYWRVNAANANGVSGWSVGTVGGMVNGDGGPISALSPANAATNISLPVIFSWSGPECECGLFGYGSPFILQVATDTGFSLVIDTGFINGGSIVTGHFEWFSYSYSPNNLNNSTTYYWRIMFVGGPWSYTSQFTTGGTSVLPVDNKHLKPDFIVSNKIISYSLSAPGQVEITFSDVLGRIALVVNRKQSVGRYSIELKNCNLAAGHYIVSFKAAGVEKQASVVITR